MSYGRQFVFKLIFKVVISIKCIEGALLYSQFTVLQLVGSISVPIADLPPERKIFFDWGFQMNYDMPFNVSSFYMIPIWATNATSRKFNAKHHYDFTAKELYKGFENMLERYGYDRSCLKRSICELSQVKFDEAYKNIVTDVIEYFLKPSIHQGFLDDEDYDDSFYKLAENQGLLGENCKELYPQCVENILNILTFIDF